MWQTACTATVAIVAVRKLTKPYFCFDWAFVIGIFVPFGGNWPNLPYRNDGLNFSISVAQNPEFSTFLAPDRGLDGGTGTKLRMVDDGFIGKTPR